MLCKDVMETIERRYPCSCAMDWDNVGLLVGRKDKEVNRIYVALDAKDEVIKAAANAHADMLVTHHPMIFSGMRRITEDDFTGRRVIRLIQEDIACYAMHTNYDVMGMAELAEYMMRLKDSQVLEVTCPEGPLDGKPQGIGRVANLEDPVTLREYCEVVKSSFSLENVRVFGNLEAPVRRVAISPGSGKSMVKAALDMQADVLVTGDIDHHTGIDSVAQGLAIIDAGHYGIEQIFVHDIAEFLRKEFPEAEVTEAPVNHPFQVV